MTPEKIHEEREALAYIKDVKEMIISKPFPYPASPPLSKAHSSTADARALYAMKGLTNRLATLDVLTSTRGGAYRATLIFYPDLTDSKQWILLYEGCQCKDLCQAMKMLWDAMQTALGDWKGKSRAGRWRTGGLIVGE